MSNNEWQENESEINVCLGKLLLFIHVSSQSYVCVECVSACVRVCGVRDYYGKSNRATHQ